MKVVVCVEPEAPGEAARGALSLAAKLQPAATVIALSAAADATETSDALQKAQQLGANRAAQLLDARLTAADAHELGFALAEAARQLGVELVLAGIRSDGEGRGIVPASVAHHLGATYWCGVEGLALDSDDPRRVTIVVRAGGRKRTLSIALPAVLAVGASAAPRDGLPGTSSSAPIETLPLADLRGGAGDKARRALGTLDKGRSKPATATSAEDLLRRWRGGGSK